MGLVVSNSFFRISNGFFKYIQVSEGGGGGLTYDVIELITTLGSGSWSKPEGITNVIVECWGGGGAGGGANNTNTGGTGGAGAQYAKKTFTYSTNFSTISYIVGAGGNGGAGNGPSGSWTSWNSTDVVAAGGAGGFADTPPDTVLLALGSSISGVGDVVYRGGNSGYPSSGIPSGIAGGDGGGGAGSEGPPVGNESQPQLLGRQEFGGDGGIGDLILSSGLDGAPGNNYGGGGSGAAKISGPNRSGGNGAQGLIRVSYTIPAPLDFYTGSTAGYSVRKLSESASFCMKVRRDSDNTFQDIGFQADGVIDTGSLLTFVGSATGYVEAWYNQVQLSGSYDAGTVSGTTFSSQPYIVSSGSLVTLNGKPALFFNSRAGIGVNNFMPQLTDPSGDFFTIGVGQVADTTTRLMVRTVNSSNARNIAQNIRRNSTNLESIVFNTLDASFTDLGPTNPGTNQFLAYVERLTTSVQLYVNNATNGSTATTSTPFSSSGQFFIGFFGGTTTPTFPWSGSIQEVIHYGQDSTVYNYREGLSSAINSFYGIY